MPAINPLVTCLCFKDQAEEAANFYVAVFKNEAKITGASRYGEAGKEIHRRPPGSVLTVEFEIRGQRFIALNGPDFKFTEAISFQVLCDTQQEIDYFWDKLSAGGEQIECGWLKDKFGVTWQVTPAMLLGMLKDHTSPQYQRVMTAMMKMKKLDIAELKRAHAG